MIMLDGSGGTTNPTTEDSKDAPMTVPISDDYQTVAERIRIFRDKYPEGSLRPADLAFPFRLLNVSGQDYVVVTAAAYRTPDDKAPGIGQAWELIPGTTEYTRGSELMNAESSAWGRAIIAVLAADSRKIATSDEVALAQQRRTEPIVQTAPQVAQPVQQPATSTPVAPPVPAPEVHNPAEDSSNRSLVDSIVTNVLKQPNVTVAEIREAWTVLSQAGLLAWRVDPFGGIDPDSDGRVTIGALVSHIGRAKQGLPA
jgi:hypothetical protein